MTNSNSRKSFLQVQQWNYFSQHFQHIPEHWQWRDLAFEMDRQVLQSIMQIQKEMYQMRKFKIFQIFLKVTGQLHKYVFSGALLSRWKITHFQTMTAIVPTLNTSNFPVCRYWNFRICPSRVSITLLTSLFSLVNTNKICASVSQ
jgi:hypothetical protein